MNGWQVQAMWEAESARIWEEMHAPDPNEGRYTEAEADIAVAIRHMGTAMDWLARAAREVEGLPLENRLLDLVDALDDLRSEAAKKDERR